MIRYIKGFDEFVTSSVALIATGWSDPSPGGNLTHWISTPFTAHSFLTLWTLTIVLRRTNKSEARCELDEAFELLSPSQKRGLWLSCYGDLSFAEIAETVGCPLSTSCRCRWHRHSRG